MDKMDPLKMALEPSRSYLRLAQRKLEANREKISKYLCWVRNCRAEVNLDNPNR